jgi:hypothetical protein
VDLGDLGLGDIFASIALGLLIPIDGRCEFDRTTSLARFGDQVVDARKIDDARLEVEQTLRSRNLTLVFGIRGTIRLALPLQRGEKDVVADHVRVTIIDMLERSQIVIPNNDPYDPTGKFARSGSPTSVTREEAVELVRSPPKPGEPLPIVL